MANIWFISKYLGLPTEHSYPARGFSLLRELRRRGHSTTLFTESLSGVNDDRSKASFGRVVQGVTVHEVATTGFDEVRSLKRVLSWVDFELGVLKTARSIHPKPDVVVASSLSLLSVLSGAVLSRIYGARFVFEVRDIWPLTLTEEGGFSPKNPAIRLLGLLERYGYRRADAIVGTMPNLEEHVRTVSRSTAPVFCVPMGYDAQRLEEESQLPSEYLDAEIPTDKFIVGYAGTVGATNALTTLFEAAKLLAEEASIHFVVVGDGDLLGSFQERYGQLKNVTFVPHVPRNSVGAVLGHFHAVYFSTFDSKVWWYGQSLNKLIDYMLSGRPVIASYSGFQSMIDEALSGVFVPAEDAETLVRELRKLAALPRGVLDRMGAQGREWVLANRRYEDLARLYEGILFPSLDGPKSGRKASLAPTEPSKEVPPIRRGRTDRKGTPAPGHCGGHAVRSRTSRSKKTKVTIISTAHGAADNRVHLREAASLAEAGYDVTLLALAPSAELPDTGVKLEVLKSRSRLSRMTLGVVAAVVGGLKTRADIYHLHDPELIPAIPLLKASGAKVVYDAHEDLPDQVKGKAYVPEPLRGPVVRFARAAVRLGGSADAVVAATGKIAQRYPGRKTTVVRNFPRLRPTKERRETSEREKTLVYVGGVSLDRGALQMVSAVAEEAFPPGWRLAVAGWLEADAESVSRDPSWDKIDFLGTLDPTAARDLISMSDVGLVCLLPTEAYRDSLPTKMFEYLAEGIPVIASDFPLWRDIVEKNQCGVLVDPESPIEIAEALAAYAADPELLEEHSENAKRAARSVFNWAREEEKLLSLYERLIQ